MAGEERTRGVFGEYVSIYNYKQAVQDGATVPLYFENRAPELKLINPQLNEDVYKVIEEAGLDEASEKKIEREIGRQYHLITRDDRMEKIAEDIVSHFMGRGHRGKGMVVCIDKPTTLRMYNKVQVYWKDRLDELRQQLKIAPESQREVIQADIVYMEAMDIAVVVSQEQNEMEEFKKKRA